MGLAHWYSDSNVHKITSHGWDIINLGAGEGKKRIETLYNNSTDSQQQEGVIGTNTHHLA